MQKKARTEDMSDKGFNEMWMECFEAAVKEEGMGNYVRIGKGGVMNGTVGGMEIVQFEAERRFWEKTCEFSGLPYVQMLWYFCVISVLWGTKMRGKQTELIMLCRGESSWSICRIGPKDLGRKGGRSGGRIIKYMEILRRRTCSILEPCLVPWTTSWLWFSAVFVWLSSSPWGKSGAVNTSQESAIKRSENIAVKLRVLRISLSKIAFRDHCCKYGSVEVKFVM